MANAMPEYGGTVLRPGASGPDIALVQRWLGGLNVDGRYGTSTETAVRRFQREQGLKIDGHVGRDTWDALYRAWADKNGEGEIWPGVTMRRGSRGATVKSAQQKLKTLVPELTTDGRYGASTREAVLAWQVVHDLTNLLVNDTNSSSFFCAFPLSISSSASFTASCIGISFAT